MNFQTFLKHYLQPERGSISAMSQFKMQNPIDYQRYRDRAMNVENYMRRSNQRSISNGHSGSTLTPENFSEMEKQANAMNKLCGRSTNYGGSTMQDSFNRLTSTQQQDVYYHALLNGRVDKETGKAEYMQSDFDWLQSEDYQNVLALRAENK